MKRTKQGTKLSNEKSDLVIEHDQQISRENTKRKKNKKSSTNGKKIKNNNKHKKRNKKKPKNGTKHGNINDNNNNKHIYAGYKKTNILGQFRKSNIIKQTRKKKNVVSDNQFEYKKELKFVFIGCMNKLMFCYHCRLSNNYDPLITCAGCGRNVHHECDNKDDDVSFEEYKNSDIEYICKECRDAQQSGAEINVTNMIEFENADKCIRWLKQQSWQCFVLLRDSLKAFVKKKIPELMTIMRKAFCLHDKQKYHELYSNNEVTMVDVANHGKEHFIQLIKKHNRDQSHLQKDISVCVLEFQRWNVLVLKLNTTPINKDDASSPCM